MFRALITASVLAASLIGGVAAHATPFLYVSSVINGIFAIDSSGAASAFGGVGSPVGLALDGAQNLYVASVGGVITKVTPGGSRSMFATIPPTANLGGMAIDAGGNLFVANINNTGAAVNEISPSGTVTTFASGLGSDPRSVTFDNIGNLYISLSDKVDKITPAGIVSTYATGFSTATGLAFDSSGNLYVANRSLNTVSKVTPDGTISTFASGLSGPHSLVIDAANDLYVANIDGTSISEISPGGVVTPFATGLSSPGYLAIVPEPSGIACLVFVIGAACVRRSGRVGLRIRQAHRRQPDR